MHARPETPQRHPSIVALGRKGTKFADDIELSENARVTDFIPFDDLLHYYSVFITNGGYGEYLSWNISCFSSGVEVNFLFSQVLSNMLLATAHPWPSA
jgi:hypothetical protein